MPEQGKTCENTHHAPACPATQHPSQSQIKVNVGKDVFIINHAYMGTHTIQEVYEDFLKRAIANC